VIIAIGVDLGKVRDYSAIVITEYTPVRMPEDGGYWLDLGPTPAEKKWITSVPDTLYQVRMLERIALGSSYPDVARRINKICRRLRKEKPGARIHLVMDQTGVGRGPVDIVRELLDPTIRLSAVNFTGTDRCDYAPLHRPEVNMGKAFLVVRLQTTLQKRLLQVPRGQFSTDLIAELASFEVHTSRTGHDTYGAFAVGTHDDLVNALGLSILGSATGDEVKYGPPIYR
jgi:hypothetical protein